MTLPEWLEGVDPADITEAHVLPVDDLVEHDSSENCICGPDCEPVEKTDGSFAYFYRHHSLDGREAQE